MPTAERLLPRLSVMMFLQFFVWGAWYVSMTGWMKAVGLDDLIGWAYTVGPIAAVVSPFFVGMIADRYFPTQVVLAVLHLAGAVIMLAMPGVVAAAGPDVPKTFFHPYVLMLLAHMLCYMPTLALTNSLSFTHLSSGQKQFPLVRVFGTIGWIVGNIAVAGSLAPWGLSGLTWIADGDKSPVQFYISGGAGILLALYAMTLPHTPPPARGRSVSAREILGLDSLKLLARPSYAIFIVCSLLLCIPLAGYYQQARNFIDYLGFDRPTITMSYGQMTEIIFMLLLPALYLRLGVKWVLAIGMFAWVARYALFAGAAVDMERWMAVLGVVLHGLCYDLFFVAGFVYVDKKASPEIRAQAQGFLVLVTQGLGLGAGAMIFGNLVASFTSADDVGKFTDWRGIWYAAAGCALVVLILFVLFFHDKGERSTEASASASEEPRP